MITPKTLIDGSAGLLTASAVTYYTCPAHTQTIIKRLSFTNTGANTTVTAYLVPSGASAANQYKIADVKAVAQNDTWSCPDAEGQVLEAGDTVQLLAADASRIAVLCGGVEVV